MRSTYKQLYYINRNKIKADGTTAIMCRVTIDGRATVLSTGLYCRPDDWNGKKGETKNSRINGMLNDYKNRIDDTYNSLLKANGVITAELLKNAITGVSDIPKYILQAGEIEREHLKSVPYRLTPHLHIANQRCTNTICVSILIRWAKRICYLRI